MHTIAIECTDKAHAHLVYIVEHILKGEATIKDDRKYEPNDLTKEVFQEIRDGKNVDDFSIEELKK